MVILLTLSYIWVTGDHTFPTNKLHQSVVDGLLNDADMNMQAMLHAFGKSARGVKNKINKTNLLHDLSPVIKNCSLVL